VLKKFEPKAETCDREVTLLLMVASSGFVVPYERLSPPHPIKDYDDFEEVYNNLKKMLGEEFEKCGFAPENPDSWLYAEIGVDDFQRGPDSWPTGKPVGHQPLSYVLGIIRNALGHGNLYTEGNPIKVLLFFSENRKREGRETILLGYKFLKVPVKEFRQFLFWWVRELSESGAPPYRQVLEAITRLEPSLS
jgi:hypothetical protein